MQRAAHGMQARRHRRQLEAPRRAPLGLAQDGGDQRAAVLRRRRVREPDRAPQLLPQPLGDGRVLAGEGDEARPLGVEPHVLGVALHGDHLDAWHGGEGAGARSVGVEVAGRQALRAKAKGEGASTR